MTQIEAAETIIKQRGKCYGIDCRDCRANDGWTCLLVGKSLRDTVLWFKAWLKEQEETHD